jgi:2-polyprenyl-3-methyl-5-hydroxy-6-metoxy-1,4-benzoquinol methylase
MKIELLELLRCPKTGQTLRFEKGSVGAHGNEEGWLVSGNGRERYPVHKGIPRFVQKSNYADNFGMQWNYFRQTQLDSHSGHPISADRFWLATGWKPEELKGKWVLDAGCGAGRFAEVALSAGAKVVALDYSSAVDACYVNLRHHPNLHVVQGDIYALPFAAESFPFVYSIGVLQHTPDVARAFAALPEMVMKGGSLCADFYWKRLRTMLHTKYLLRPLTKRMNQSTLFQLLQYIVPSLLTLSQTLGRVPLVGRGMKRIVPVADYTGRYPLSAKQLREWALLDTFDMLAPAYDNPQTVRSVRLWFEQAGFDDVEVGHWGHLTGRGVKSLQANG